MTSDAVIGSKPMRGITAVAAAWALAACATYTDFRPVEAPGGEGAFQRAQRAVVTQGLAIESADEKAGIIATTWTDASGMGTDRQYRWIITVDPTSIVIDSQCRMRLEDPGPFTLENPHESCGERQHGRRQQEAAALADAMMR